jgi:hypothetical protein
VRRKLRKRRILELDREVVYDKVGYRGGLGKVKELEEEGICDKVVYKSGYILLCGKSKFEQQAEMGNWQGNL